MVAGLLFVAGVVAFVIIPECYVRKATEGRMFDDAHGLPDNAIGLILGCSPHLADGRSNVYFLNRIEAGVKLWESGKIKAMIVSGDNRWHEYNEPDAMKAALVKKGVPEDRIVCDYAGLRTLDSVVRAEKIFGAKKVIIVSQEFHNERALSIAWHYGFDTYAYNAKDIHSRAFRLKSWVRERAARVAMLLDLWVLGTKPRHMGQEESLPE